MTFDSREQSAYDGAPVECYRFALAATTYLWTSAEAQVVLPTGTYTPMPIERSELDYSEEEGGGNLEVTVPIDSAIATPFMPSIPGASLVLTLYRAHRGEESLAQPRFFGSCISIVTKNDAATLTFAPFHEALRRLVPTLSWQPICNWPLYGVGCGVLAASFRDSAVVGSVSGVTVVSSTFAARPSGWYRNGWMEDPAGDVRMIVAHVGDTITLMNAFGSLAAAQTVQVFAGCDRTEATCRDKFNNFARHLGFPRVPSINPFVRTIG